MKFKNILNKPYKYGGYYKHNKFSTIINKLYTFYKISNFKFIFHLKKSRLFKIYTTFYNTIYKNLKFLKILKNRLDIRLTHMGLCKTIKQSNYLISKGKILLNGNLIKVPKRTLNIGTVVKIMPFLYNQNFYNNINLFKNYLRSNTNIVDILNSNIININTHIIHIIK